MIRNAVMFDYAVSSQSDVFVQSTGRSHLFGNRRTGFSYQGSLEHQFNTDVRGKQGEHVYCLKIYPTLNRPEEKLDTIPTEARDNLETHMTNTIIMDGLRRKRFPKYIFSGRRECSHIRKEFSALGMQHTPLLDSKIREWKSQARDICQKVSVLKMEA
jgi:hypothetical protein